MKNKNQKNLDRLKNIINIDKKKIEKTAKDNEKNINISEEIKKFCIKYVNDSIETRKTNELHRIIDEGNGLLNMYFIANNNSEDNQYIIVQIEYIIMKATNQLNIIHMNEMTQKNTSINHKLKATMEKAKKLENNATKTYRQLKTIKNEQKSIIATIISIILAISIIPTAIVGIQNINANFILPFLSSLLLFGIIMISFTFSLYSESFKKRILLFLILVLTLCIGTWIISFKYDIRLEQKNNKEDNYNSIINEINI